MLNYWTITVYIIVVIPLLFTGCIADHPAETQESPQNNDDAETAGVQQENLRPKDISVENLGENKHHFNITIISKEGGSILYSNNLSLSPQSEKVIERVASKKGEYRVTVHTEDGLSEQFTWRVDRDHHDLKIIYHDSNLRITQSVN